MYMYYLNDFQATLPTDNFLTNNNIYETVKYILI